MNLKSRVILGIMMASIAVALILWFANPPGNNGNFLVASGTVEAVDAQLGFQVPGLIEEIAVHEGETVKSGLALAHLDRTETAARREQAAAQVTAARAALREMERGFRSEEVAQGRAALTAAEDRLQDARRDLDRTRRLYDSGAASLESYDKAQLAFDLAKSQDDQARQQMKILETGQRVEKIEAQRAQLAQAEAAVRTLDASLANMMIRSPFDGLVTVRHHEPGEIVSAGAPILTVMNPGDRWVRIYIPETRIGAVRIGQTATVTSDTFPDKKYPGRVVFIASEAEFTPKTVQTSEERVKLVYAVKVRILGDPEFDLKPGIPADVRIALGIP